MCCNTCLICRILFVYVVCYLRNPTYRVRFNIRHKQRVPLDVITARELEKKREREVTHEHAYLPHFRTPVFSTRQSLSIL